MTEARLEVTGLAPLVRQLRGPMFKEVNRELRQYARLIAADLVPVVADAVRASPAPQAPAMAGTVRVHPDRVPVVVVGKVNPRFRVKFTRKGGDSKQRRGALAHGVIYGPLGGKKSTSASENYYKIPRDESGGTLGESLKTGPIFDKAAELYLKFFLRTMEHHGFMSDSGNAVHWGG